MRVIVADPQHGILSYFQSIPHLAAHYIESHGDFVLCIQWLEREMTSRFQTLQEANSKSLKDFNSTARTSNSPPLPLLIIIIDNFNIFDVSRNEIALRCLSTLLHKGHRVGIHFVISTPRPDAKTIPGVLRSKITTQIAFAVPSEGESRIILDEVGAESLRSRGDLLFKSSTNVPTVRVQGAFLTDDELSSLVEFWKKQVSPNLIGQPGTVPPWGYTISIISSRYARVSYSDEFIR